MRSLLAVGVALCCAGLSGCGVSNSSSSECKPNPVPYTFTVGPAANELTQPDHSASPPGNQEHFQAQVAPDPGPGCPVPQWVALDTSATWSVSDTTDVQINSSAGNTNGLATCVGATNGPVTVTATGIFGGFTLTNTSTITCK